MMPICLIWFGKLNVCDRLSEAGMLLGLQGGLFQDLRYQASQQKIDPSPQFIGPSIWSGTPVARDRELSGVRQIDCRSAWQPEQSCLLRLWWRLRGPTQQRPRRAGFRTLVHFYPPLTGPFRDDDRGRSAPVWGCLSRGLIGLDSRVMGLEKKKGSPAPLNFPHSSVIPWSQQLTVTSLHLSAPENAHDEEKGGHFPPTALKLSLQFLCFYSF